MAHAIMWMNLKNMFSEISQTQKNAYYVILFRKFPEKAKLQRPKAKQLLFRAGGKASIAANGHQGTFWGDGSILKLDYSDGYTTVWLYYK